MPRMNALAGLPLVVTDEVSDAIASGDGVVALESTIISHGLPSATSAETARRIEDAVRQAGATPATLGVLDGQVRVGLGDDDLVFAAPGQRDGVATHDRQHDVRSKGSLDVPADLCLRHLVAPIAHHQSKLDLARSCLVDLKLAHREKILQQMDDEFAGNLAAAPRAQQIQPAPRDLPQHGQAPAAGARRPAGDRAIAIQIAHEWHPVIKEIGDDDISLLPVRRLPSLVVHDFHQQMFHREVKAFVAFALRADQHELATSVGFDDRAAERALDRLALNDVELFGAYDD
jgi:hypothetical protein